MIASEPIVTTQQASRNALNQLIWSFAPSRVVYVAAKLGIADVLRDGPKPAQFIAEQVGADQQALHRLLRALTAVDILIEHEDGQFATTPTGVLLQSDHPQSLREFSICIGDQFVWQPWGELYTAVQTGQPTFDRIYGEPFFDYFKTRPAESAIFNAGMTSISSNDLPDIMAAYDFTGCNKIVDIGGGEGVILRTILEQYSHTTGVLFDVPTVIADAHDIRNSAVADRCELVSGDMFQAVPAGGDTYMMRWILHDWSDAEAIQILRNCRRAISDQGRVLLIELLLAPSNIPDGAKWLDLNMLVLLTGRERNEADFRDLYAAAGFRLNRIIPAGNMSLIEGVAV